MEVDSEEEKPVIEDDDDSVKESKSAKPKVSKPGIIYLSTIPPGMNVKQIREYFSEFGEIHRSFLQPEKSGWKGKKRNQTFTEGWIEFKKRRHARNVAKMLNNCPVGGKKRKVYHDFLWNIKYLTGFQWIHLNERLAYERISMKKKIAAEISAAKREVNFFAKSVDLSKNLKRKGILNRTAPTTPASKSNDIQTISKPETSRPAPPPSNNKKSGLTEERRNFLKSLFTR